MTIEYLDSKRIVATSTEGKSTVTFEDDFTTDKGWTTTDASKYSVNTCGWISFDPSSDQTDNRISIDIGTTLCDTAWVMRWKQEITTFVQGSAGQHLSLDIGIADREVNGATAIGIIKAHHASNVSVNYTNISGYPVTCGTEYDSYGGTPSYPNGHVCGFTPSAKTNWVEMKRTGATSASLAFYTCSSFATLDGSVKEVTIGNPTGLRYVMLGSEYAGQIAGTARYTGKFSELKIYDGVTSVVEETQRPTDVEDNSLWLEKDVSRRYWFDAESARTPTFEDDTFSTGWTETGSGSSWSVTSNALTFVDSSAGTERLYYDNTSTISDTAWVTRFKLDITAFTQGTVATSEWVLFGWSSTTADSASTQDAVLFTIRNNSTSASFAITANGSGAPNGSLGQTDLELLQTGTFYIEIIRDGDDFTLNVRNNSHSGTLLGTQSYTVSNVSSLRYLKAMNHDTASTDANTAGNIDDVEFYDGVTNTTAPATWTMQPTKHFDLSTSAGWTTTGSNCLVNTSGKYLEGSSSTNDDRATKALGITLSDTKFVVRQKMELTDVTTGGNGQLYFGYTDKDNSTTVLGNRDAIGITIRTGADFLQSYALNQAWQSSATLTTTPTETTYYLEMIRDSATSHTLNLYSDSDYSVLIETKTNTISSSINGLDHITIGGWDNSASGNITARFSNIEIYNGVNTVN